MYTENDFIKKYVYAASEITLPFSYAATISTAPRPAGLDFPHEPNPDNSQVFVRIENDLWQFRCPWITGKGVILRYKGPDIDHMVQVEDGVYPKELDICWFLGGMWYDESQRKLYAPMHIETSGIHRWHPIVKWSSRKVVLATSTDNGKTWNYEGDIIEPETYYYNHEAYKFSGSYLSNGLCDYGFYTDIRGGYFYIFPEEGWCPKGEIGAYWGVRAARCAIKDKMAPGKWNLFYNGRWDESALGGRSSIVAPSHLWGIIYSTYLDKYICMINSNRDPTIQKNLDGVYIGACSDLSKQDWIFGYCPEAMFGFMNVTNEEGIDVISCDKTFRFYSYWAGNTFQRLDITLEAGRTNTPDMSPRYTFEAHPESSDPILSRKTKIVGVSGGEAHFTGQWEACDELQSYEGIVKRSSTKGSTMELSFKGAEIYWRTVFSPNSGKADVHIDGEFCNTVDCYSPKSVIYERFSFIKSGLAPDRLHTIKIVVRGDRNTKSGGCEISHIAFEYPAESYKASAGFSSIMGKNRWHYQLWDGSVFSDMQFLPDDVGSTNYWFGEGNCKVGNNYQIPDAKASIRKWIAPHDGAVLVEGKPAVETGPGQGLSAAILHNNAYIWPMRRIFWKEYLTHSLIVEVKNGDEISFVASKWNPRADFDKLTWDPVITYEESQPEIWTPNPAGNKNLALFAYARSKVLVCGKRPFDAVDGSEDSAFVVYDDDMLSVGDDWLMLDLYKRYLIDSYTVISRPKNCEYRPRRFKLQSSKDRFIWEDIDYVLENACEKVERTVPAFTARYVRLYLPEGKPFQINEFELYYRGIKHH